MCMFKSMLLLKDKVFCPNYDSHEDMINETGMEHGPMRENFVRVEITPPDDLTVPIDKWEYKVDQDYLPEWYVEEVDKPRCFDALKAWAVKHILVGQDVPEVKQGEFVVLVNCNTGIVKGTVQKVWDGTVQEVWDGGTVQKQTGGIVIYADGRISVCNKNFYRLVTPEKMLDIRSRKWLTYFSDVFYTLKGDCDVKS